jgi:NAD+ diphosphatase
MEMRYCIRCGAELTEREHPTDGRVPYCEACGDYRFPVFSTAVSVAVLNQEGTETLLIRQYGEEGAVLVAGYVDKEETAEHAARRELMEELGLTALELRYLGSHYYAPSETLMLNFAATVTEREARPNFEVDSWEWYKLEDARNAVAPGGLAEELLGDLEAIE